VALSFVGAVEMDLNPPHEVSILMINFNSSRYTIDCVRSLIRNTRDSIDYNIIVVDNNSDPPEYRALSTLGEYKNVLIVRSRVNLGFSGGHTFGLQFTNAKYYFFLNNDCIVLNDCVGILYEFCESTQTVAMCAPQLYNDAMEHHSTFQYPPTLMSKFFGYSFVRLFNKALYPSMKNEYESPLKVSMLSGTAMFVRAAVFNRIGGFDTNYFLYNEEEDLSLRLGHEGYGIYLVPAARVQHFGRKSTIMNTEIAKEFYISYFYFYRKHYGCLKTLVLKGLVFLKLLKKSFKSGENLRLAGFVLFRAKPWNSMRHRQVIR